MDFSDILWVEAYAIDVLGGVSQFWPEVSVRGTICAIYIILFGLGNALLGWRHPLYHARLIPPQVARYASFMFSFIGRGVCTIQELLNLAMAWANEYGTVYIFIGGLCFSGHWTKYIIGGIIILVGITYVALEYVPSIEPPANMR
ncbi:hypothetical protein E4T52_03616 [Aureobasidium sp. EXF-3400]|nr:hypothetical protein E4T51_02743 [Aureobasidium sp. EXF-12344]KAI4781522.1 hypothetical protein E4T52_03616 [Aureobasidium sp. EXF-3400]